MSEFDVSLGNDTLPGMGAVVEQPTRNFKRDQQHPLNRVEGIMVDKNCVDVGNTGDTTTLRPGLVLFKGANDRYVQASHGDAPASGDVVAGEVVILDHYLNLKDKTGTVQHKPAAGLISGFVYDAQIIYVDAGYKDAAQAALKLVDFR